MGTAFAAFVAGSLNREHFTFIDIGCSGGIDPAWRVFGDRLRAVAFDASVEECNRLTAIESHPNIKYVGGFVGLDKRHPFAEAAALVPLHLRSFFSRTSAGRIAQLLEKRLKEAPLEEKLLHNAWNMTELGDPDQLIIVPDMLTRLGWADVDFLKIDIDGPDFQVLHSFDRSLDKIGLLAARLEVNLYGGTEPTEHVFHNTDRFMRDRGFELLGLEVRTYAMSALPSQFAITAPAQTISGRPFQAEAFYARDPAGDDWRASGAAMPPEKMAKLAAIFSVWEQPDAAAELLVEYRTKFDGLLDVDIGLELLAGQAQAKAPQAAPYADYVAAFEAGDRSFYPSQPTSPRSGMPSIARRTRAAMSAFCNPDRVL